MSSAGCLRLAEVFCCFILQQNKMEDCLGEARHVLRNHAVGTGPGSGLGADMHSLLSAAAGAAGLSSLSQSFPLHGRLSGMVPEHHEESAGLPPTSGLLHVHHAPPQAPASSQPDAYTSESQAHVVQQQFEILVAVSVLLIIGR